MMVGYCFLCKIKSGFIYIIKAYRRKALKNNTVDNIIGVTVASYLA